jgi:alkaline phosphatase D
MKYIIIIFTFLLLSCKQPLKKNEFNNDLIISFGSCNNQRIQNELFDDIVKNKPAIFIWGGDIIYSDTDNPLVLANNYQQFKQDSTYQQFLKKVKVVGTWDDHDYGLNDGGFENPIKEEAKHLFLDFFNVPKQDKKREQEGVYSSTIVKKDSNFVKVILLDTRYFRTKLTNDSTGEKRYIPNKYGEGNMLGDTQWNWLENELSNSTANYNIIVSSIQFLSKEHGFEAWGNMPHEIDRLQKLILKSKAKNVIILSGDRHIAEISKTNIGKFKYPLIDFTSSGLTHAYTSFSGEKNPFRISNVIHQINFGILKFDFKANQVLFEIRGKDNILLEHFKQQY